MLKLNNKNKLLYSIMSLLLLGLLASTFVSYIVVRSNLLESLQNEQLLKANSASVKLSQWFNNNLNTIALFADTLSNSNAPLRNNPEYEFFMQQTMKTKGFAFIYFGLEEDGYSWFTNWEIPADYDPRKRPWYQASKLAGTPIITDPYLGMDDSQQLYIAITAPILRNKEFTGVVSGDLTLDFVTQTVLNIELDMGGYALLVERNGNMLIHPNQSMQGSQLDQLPELTQQHAKTLLSETNTQIDTQDYLFYSFPIANTNWHLVFTLPKLILNSVIVSKTLNLLAFFLAIFMTIAVLFYTLNRRLLTPLIEFLEQDATTGLPNKRHFKQLVSNQELNPNQDGMLLIISTDDFNQLTATYPAAVINELQKQICHRIESSLDEKSILGVFSESRFIAYIPNSKQLQERDQILQLQTLNDNLNRVYRIAENKLNCSIRIGASFFPQHGNDIEMLIDKAFSVMALAKKQRKTDISIYSPDIDNQLSNDLLIASAMRNALRKSEFYMVYQPQYDLKSGKFTSVESLIRWNSTELQRAVSPYEFIPVAEASNLIIELGYSIIDMVAYQISEWSKGGISFNRVSINISPKQLQQEDFLRRLETILEKYSVSPQSVELEITETSLLEDPDHSIQKLEQLKLAGFSIAIDDFGTGYSSMQYLTNIPFSKLKIDRAFISDLEGNQKNQLIIKMLSDMAQALNFTLLAEGAETEAQIQLLNSIGCHMVQGYFYAKPMPASQLNSFVAVNNGSTTVADTTSK